MAAEASIPLMYQLMDPASEEFPVLLVHLAHSHHDYL
jgi:hypothetical protein